MNFHNARKQRTIQSPFENIRLKVDPENIHGKILLLFRSKSQRPLTNEKLSPLNRNERTKILTTFQMGG